MAIFLIERGYRVCVEAASLQEAEAALDQGFVDAISDNRAQVLFSTVTEVNSASQVNDDLLDEVPIGGSDLSSRDILNRS